MKERKKIPLLVQLCHCWVQEQLSRITHPVSEHPLNCQCLVCRIVLCIVSLHCPLFQWGALEKVVCTLKSLCPCLLPGSNTVWSLNLTASIHSKIPRGISNHQEVLPGHFHPSLSPCKSALRCIVRVLQESLGWLKSPLLPILFSPSNFGEDSQSLLPTELQPRCRRTLDLPSKGLAMPGRTRLKAARKQPQLALALNCPQRQIQHMVAGCDANLGWVESQRDADNPTLKNGWSICFLSPFSSVLKGFTQETWWGLFTLRAEICGSQFSVGCTCASTEQCTFPAELFLGSWLQGNYSFVLMSVSNGCNIIMEWKMCSFGGGIVSFLCAQSLTGK